MKNNIDSIIQAWADKHQLVIYKSYKDEEVRSTDVVDQRGRKYQIWIDPPIDIERLNVHAWDYKKRKKQYTGALNGLGACLEEAYRIVQQWMKE